ncbi:mandelate racemase/muconate lactonizing enzyme family protein [Cupriavidus necator]|uniref:mandelate racemase/muconate lactonizing enzyme family protein n=1 Tax=Cupriavidus necator TaxID=106590 RepID=UPI0014902732|nr:mandelate racemase/muconate lactonizing enzyme family protein [Cupriavidus necator]NOV24493.1 mandelate racemase/muconate lactonizing enzyme family protein [Cupriavidus necator]
MTKQIHRIASVEALHVGQFLYARIRTEAGLTGYGEAGSWGHIEAASAALEKFGRYLVGKDANQIELHWNVMQRFSHFRGTAVNAAVSAIDIALWDLLGKRLEAPVWQLLGGAYRDKLRVYGHVYAETLEEVLADCRRLREEGFTAVGHINPFLDEPEGQSYFRSHAGKVRDAKERVMAFREAVGSDVDLLIEMHRRLSPAEAIAIGQVLEPLTPMWLEDPLRPEFYQQMTTVGQSIRVPIATGERFSTPAEFALQLSGGAVRYARTSVCVCGGITGAKKIAALAEAQNVDIAPHNPLSPISLAACMQVAAAVPNFAIQEYPTGFENLVLKSGNTLLGSDLVKSHPVPKAGFIAVPDAPGIGVELVDDVENRRAPLYRPVSMRSTVDGAPLDQ